MRHDEEVDLVIMDLTLKGGLDGEEAARGILGINPQAKIVASSGGMLSEARASYLARGFCEILPKPYLTDQISDVVHRALNQHAAGTEVSSVA
jgi:DNA-binding NtrC family response regulator